MLGFLRSNSSPLCMSPVQSLDGGVDFVDHYGALRRSNTVTKRMILRGTSVGNPVFLQPGQASDESKDQEQRVPLTPEEIERMHHEKMLRRQELLSELMENKRKLLLDQHQQTLDRLQLWHDASELDPAIELTKENTPRRPSSKAQSFIDESGNIRRKSLREPTPVDTSTADASKGVLGAVGAAATIAPRRSQILEFVQLIVED